MSKLSVILMDRPIAYHPILAKSLGGVKPALFLSQLLYWSPRATLPDGWIRKDADEFEEETGMTRREQNTARAILIELGVLEHKVKGIPATSHYRINMEALETVLPDGSIQFEQKRQTGLDKSAKLASTKAPNYNESEITTENTTEIAASPSLSDFGIERKFESGEHIRKGTEQAISDGLTANDNLTAALSQLTGVRLTRPTKTEQGYINDLREEGATPADCQRFAHYWQTEEAWRGLKNKPSLKVVWERWATVKQWKPTPGNGKHKTGGWISTPSNARK